MESVKKVKKIVTGYPTQDGAGVHLIRVIGHDDVYDADPFLMLDAFDSTNPADYIKGFPLHPHRGIETVTYLIHGQVIHRDSLGNSGSIGPGQSQWMTAGGGILHEEMPQKSDRLFGLQLWVNLPKKDKMTEPHYFDINEDMIAKAEYDWGFVRVVAGEYDGHKGAQPKYTQITMLDVSVNPTTSFSMPVEYQATVLIYILEGEGDFGKDGETAIPRRTAAIFGEGDNFLMKAGKDGCRFMLFAGVPLREPVAWGGPIVMNTREELMQAFDELDRGTFIK